MIDEHRRNGCRCVDWIRAVAALARRARLVCLRVQGRPQFPYVPAQPALSFRLFSLTFCVPVREVGTRGVALV